MSIFLQSENNHVRYAILPQNEESLHFYIDPQNGVLSVSKELHSIKNLEFVVNQFFQIENTKNKLGQ